MMETLGACGPERVGVGQFFDSLDLALRPGTQHSAAETEFNFECVVPMAQRPSLQGPKAPILVRADSGFDSAKLMAALHGYNRSGLPRVDWLVKWNPRATDRQALLDELDADPDMRWQHPRPGKRQALWEQELKVQGIDSRQRPLRRVMRLIERTIDAKGQLLLVPQLTLEGCCTSLASLRRQLPLRRARQPQGGRAQARPVRA
jgi:hypothetical protein